MAVTVIEEDGEVLARHIPADDAWRDGLNFFSADADFVQVGSWGYQSGKALAAHSHNRVERSVPWTQEVLYVRTGSLRADIYDTKRSKVAELTVCAGDILVLLRGGHGYVILEDDTKVLEIKNGPYPGAEADRTRL